VENQRNIILAVLLTALVLFGWDAGVGYFYPQAKTPVQTAAAGGADKAVSPLKPTREGGIRDAADLQLEQQDLKTALASGGRVPIAAPGVAGSINLKGAILDDLVLNRHRETVKKDSGPVRIYSPAGTPAQQFAQFGWVADGIATPNAQTVWTAPAGAKLTPQTPLTLTWRNGTGQTFAITFAIDNDYLITASQRIANGGAGAIGMQPFGLINRTDLTASLDTWNVHSGPIGAFDGSVAFNTNYKDVVEGGTVAKPGRTDWIGFTDVYWMSALAPVNAPAAGTFRSLGNDLFRSDLVYDKTILQPGQQLERTTKLFAGAKEHNVLDRYEDGGITKFGLSIDWGWFRWFEKPIFWLLTSLFKLVGNFGVAIILLTRIVRGIMFPVAQRQFASMAAMKAIQPKMKAIQERYKDDKQTQQQKVMELYKTEKVNPLAGCLPVFLQIPVFFALYKVLFVTIEMRHAPFFGWIHDLSAPDPTNIFTLFGAIPWDPPHLLHMPVWAIIMGITMFLQQKLNPAPPDPIQAKIFQWMPVIFTFMLASFPAGLVIYWSWNNLLSIAQQAYIGRDERRARAAELKLAKAKR